MPSGYPRTFTDLDAESVLSCVVDGHVPGKGVEGALQDEPIWQPGPAARTVRMHYLRPSDFDSCGWKECAHSL